MAFPTIPTVAAGRLLSTTQTNGAALRTFPSLSGLTKNSGDLLIAICAVYQSSASSGAVFSAWGGGFTEFYDASASHGMAIGAAYKFSTGTETGTFTVTQAATVTGHAAMFLLSIPGVHPSTPPEGSIHGFGTISAGAPLTLNPAGWGTQDTLWTVVGVAGENATSGTWTGVTAAPTNYTNFVRTGLVADVAGAIDAAVAFRQLTAASETAGSFTVDLTSARNMVMLFAVRPVPILATITTAQELNSAQPIVGTTVANEYELTLVTETTLVGEIVPLQPLPATETDTAIAGTFPLGKTITTATVTAAAQALNVDKAVTITLAAEIDTTPSSGTILFPAGETDSAQALVIAHASYDVTPATETDLAGDIVTFQPLPAETTNTAQALDVVLTELVLTPATETAQAQILSFTLSGAYLIVAATETDLANTIVSLRPLPAETTATVLALDAIHGGRHLVPALETDSVLAAARGTGISLTEWEATAPLPYNSKAAVGDISTAVALTKTTGIGQNKSITPVTETDTALARTASKRIAPSVLVSTTDTAQALTSVKTYNFTHASSTTSVLGLTFSQATSTTYTIDAAVETTTVFPVVLLKEIFMTLGVVTTTNIARITRAANRPSGGLALIDHDPDSGLILTDQTETEDLVFIDI